MARSNTQPDGERARALEVHAAGVAHRLHRQHQHERDQSLHQHRLGRKKGKTGTYRYLTYF